MKNIFCYQINHRPTDYRLDIIKEGKSEFFFTLGISNLGNNRLKCHADISGYGPLSSYVEMPCRAAVNILAEIIKGMISAMDVYILPWDYVLSTQSAYTDRTGEKVKLIYIPSTGSNENQFVSTIMHTFSEELEEQISVEEKNKFKEIVSRVFGDITLRPEEALRELYTLQSELDGPLDLSDGFI